MYKSFNFDKSLLYLFFLLLLVLAIVHLRNHCLTLLRFTICFSNSDSLASICFCILGNFAYHIRSRSRSILCMWIFVSIPFCWEKNESFLYWSVWQPFKKNQCSQMYGFISLDYQLYSIDLCVSLSHCFEFLS